MIDGKYLSYILRHAPSAANVELDDNGYVRIDALINGIKQTGRNTDLAELETIVANDGKGRFSFNEDRTEIRANYGHSVAVNLQMRAVAPPEFLYHGTAKKFLDGIAAEGIKKQSRNFVHLSADLQTASEVGARHGQSAVLQIAAQQMHRDGFVFYLSDSGVWLTEFVPSEYIFQTDDSASPDGEISSFEMTCLRHKRTGICGKVWVYDTVKSIDSSLYRIIYENTATMIYVYFNEVFPKVCGKAWFAVSELPQIIRWIGQNKAVLLKLYRREGDYDIVDFLNEMQPLSTPEK